jgi:thioesterase-3
MKTSVEIKIRGYHVDQFNHVNNARYLEFLEEGRWDYSEKNNLIDIFHQRNIGHVAVSANINYRKSAFTGQVIRVETDVAGKTRRSLTMRQNIFLSQTDTLIVNAEVVNVYLNAATGEVIPIDEEFINLWPDLAGFNDKQTEITR